MWLVPQIACSTKQQMSMQRGAADMHYGAKQESVARTAREHDPAYGGSVSAAWFAVQWLNVRWALRDGRLHSVTRVAWEHEGGSGVEVLSNVVALLCSSGLLCCGRQRSSDLGRSFELGRSRPVAGLSRCPTCVAGCRSRQRGRSC